MKSKISFSSLFVLILFFVIPLKGQDNAAFFPYNQNNYWEYEFLAGPFGQPDTIVSISIFDTVDNEGKRTAVFDSYFINPIKPPALLPDSGIYIIDTALNVYTNWRGYWCENDLVYKLNGGQGDQWVICNTGGGNGYEMARINEIYDDVVLGVSTKVMWISYFLAADSTDTTGLDRGGDLLAKGFGLLGRQGEGWPGIFLKGAVINGILYGDTTNIVVGVREQNQFNQPENFGLYQNYPNPFNPSTIIKYTIGTQQFVTLKIYDVLGNEVAVLVNENESAGSYSVEFYADNFPSGIYFYTLTSGSFTASKKLMLLK